MRFRTRLLATSLATLAIGLAAILVAGNVIVAQRVRSEASHLLTARVEAQVAALSVTPRGIRVHETANDDLLDRRSWVLEGDRVVERPGEASSGLDRAAVALGRAHRVAERAGPADTRLRAEPVFAPGSSEPAGAVVVAMSVAPLDLLQREVLLGSLAVAALLLLAGGFTVRRAVDGALQPVMRMTAAAEDWQANDLDGRFDLGPPRDELTRLAGTLDGLLARIAAARRHEQRFASEVAHELRTPLARLRGRAELALGASGEGADAEREAALRSVVAQVTRLDEAVDALLAVARHEAGPHAGTVDVAAISHEIEDVVVTTTTDLPPAEGEPELVRRVLAPLVDNARRHARSTVTLELSSDGTRVVVAVRDDGPGLEPGLRERVFEPGVRGPDGSASGAGLGLPLARRLARACGGDVVAGSGPGGCFLLELPAAGS